MHLSAQGKGSHLGAPFDGAVERRVVRKLQIGAHGDPVGKPSDANVEGLEQLGNVHGRGLPLRVGVRGHDDLLHVFRRDPLQQFLDADIVGPDHTHG